MEHSLQWRLEQLTRLSARPSVDLDRGHEMDWRHVGHVTWDNIRVNMQAPNALHVNLVIGHCLEEQTHSVNAKHFVLLEKHQILD